MPNEDEKSEYANVSKKHHAHKTLHEHNTKSPQTPTPTHSDGTPINYSPIKNVEVKGQFDKVNYDISDTTDVAGKAAVKSMLGIK